MEWRAHTTQIRHIEADAKKHCQEVLTTTNVIQDAIKKNNIIFTEKWETTHNHIDHRSEDIHLLKNRVVELAALTGLQQTILQSCQSTIAGLEETILKLAASVTMLEGLICHCRDHLLSLAPHYGSGEEEGMVDTGGKGSNTQWVHAEYIVGSETIRPPFTQQVRGGYFSKVPTKVPTG